MSNSFLKKLQKGMGIKCVNDEQKPEETEQKPTEKPLKEAEEEIKQEPEEEIKDESIKDMSVELKIEKEKKPKAKKISRKVKIKKPAIKEEKWPQIEGQLAVDVYQTDSHLVVRSAIAGIRPEILDISIEKDLLTIKGERKRPIEENEDYFFQECYWGQFSRQIILPVEVNPNQIDAALKEGILTIRMPKILRDKKRKITIKEN